MDLPGEQLVEVSADDIDQSVSAASEQWSSRRKIESIDEKVSWSGSSSVGALVRGDNQGEDVKRQVQADGAGVFGDIELPSAELAAMAVSSSKKWSSSQQVTESYADEVIEDGEAGSVVVVRNRSARRVETHSESIVTRKVRSQLIELELDDEEDQEGDNEDDLNEFTGHDDNGEDEQLVSALSAPEIERKKSRTAEVSSSGVSDGLEESPVTLQQQATANVRSIASVETSTWSSSNISQGKTMASCWSSEARESFESVESCCLEESVQLDGETEEELIDTLVEGNANRQVWSKGKDEYERSSSRLSLSHETWSSIHSETIESEIICTQLREKLMDQDHDQANHGDDDIGIDMNVHPEVDNCEANVNFNSNCSSRDISRSNSCEDHEDGGPEMEGGEKEDADDDQFEPEKEIAVSIRRPSLSQVSAEAYVFHHRKSLEELETEIVIRKKRKPKLSKELVETATIFISTSSDSESKEPSPPSSPSSSSLKSASLTDFRPDLSLLPILETRRTSLIETFNNRGSLDTETDSVEDEETEEGSEDRFNGLKSKHRPGHLKDMQFGHHQFDEEPEESPSTSPIIDGTDFHWDRVTSSVFKGDQEINDLF